jgi:hypothetical protein
MNLAKARRVPYLTLAVMLISVGIALGEQAAAWSWQRGGPWWGIFTAHFSHWTSTHAMWDLLALAALGGLAEVLNRRRYVVGLGLTVLISLPLIVVLTSDLNAYRGSSTLACTAAGLIAAAVWQRCQRSLAAVFLFGVLVKPLWECLHGHAVFADLGEAQVLPLAHVVGTALGVLTSIAWSFWSRPTSATVSTQSAHGKAVG